VAAIVLLSDRFPDDVLPALGSAGFDVKSEPLAVASLADALDLSPELVLVDAAENPGQGHAVLRALRQTEGRTPAGAVGERPALGGFPWDQVAAGRVPARGAPSASGRSPPTPTPIR